LFWGDITKTLKMNYQIIAVTAGLILLGGTISGSTPIVFADHIDLKDKFAKLKELIAQWKANKKCPDKKKYEGECDNKKPKIKIESPEKRENVPGSSVMITGTASDNGGSGVKEILVKVDRGSYEPAEFDSGTGTWKITKELDDGRHFVFAKAIDKVGIKILSIGVSFMFGVNLTRINNGRSPEDSTQVVK